MKSYCVAYGSFNDVEGEIDLGGIRNYCRKYLQKISGKSLLFLPFFDNLLGINFRETQ